MMVWVLSFTNRRRPETVSRDKGLVLRAARHWRSFGYLVRVDRMPLAEVGRSDPFGLRPALVRSGPFMSKRVARHMRRYFAAKERSVDPT